MAAQLFNPGTPVDFSKLIDQSIVNGCTAIVTGGASGIGLAIATALVEYGAKVTIADTNEVAGTKIINSLQANGHVQFVKTDVTSWDDQVTAFEKAASLSSSKTVDIVIPAAGVTSQLKTVSDPPKLDKPMKPSTLTFDVNLYGAYYSIMLALWYFARSPPNPAKQLLFVASMAGYASPNGETLEFDYASSKFAVRGLFQKVRTRGKQYGGMRVNLLAPNFIDTPMLEPGLVDMLKGAGIKVGTTADVVDGAMRCLCDSGVNARALAICGGEANGGEPGTANFDLCDDVPSHLAGSALLENAGRLLTLPNS